MEEISCKWEFKRGPQVGSFCGRKIRKKKEGIYEGYCSLHSRLIVPSSEKRGCGGEASTLATKSPSVCSSSRVSLKSSSTAVVHKEDQGCFYDEDELRRQFSVAEKLYLKIIENELIDETVISISKAKTFAKASNFGNVPPKDKIIETLFANSSCVVSKVPSVYRFKETKYDELPPGDKSEELTTPCISKYLFQSPIMRAFFFTQTKVWWEDLFEGLYRSFVCMDILTLSSDPEIRSCKNSGRKDSLKEYEEILKLMFENFTSMNFNEYDAISIIDLFRKPEKLFSLWRIPKQMIVSRNNSDKFKKPSDVYNFICDSVKGGCFEEKFVETFVTTIFSVGMFLTYSFVREDLSLEEIAKVALCACCCLSFPKSSSRPSHQELKNRFIPIPFTIKEDDDNRRVFEIVDKWLSELQIDFYNSFVKDREDLIRKCCIIFLKNVFDQRTSLAGIQIEEFMGLVGVISYVYNLYGELLNETDLIGIFSNVGRIEGLEFVPRSNWFIKEFGQVKDYGSRELLFASGKVFKMIMEIEKKLKARRKPNMSIKDQRRWEGIYGNQFIFIGSFAERCLKFVLGKESDEIYDFFKFINMCICVRDEKDYGGEVTILKEACDLESQTHTYLNEKVMEFLNKDVETPLEKSIKTSSYVKDVFSYEEEDNIKSSSFFKTSSLPRDDDVVKVVRRQKPSSIKPSLETKINEDAIKRHLQKASLMVF